MPTRAIIMMVYSLDVYRLTGANTDAFTESCLHRIVALQQSQAPIMEQRGSSAPALLCADVMSCLFPCCSALTLSTVIFLLHEPITLCLRLFVLHHLRHGYDGEDEQLHLRVAAKSEHTQASLANVPARVKPNRNANR